VAEAASVLERWDRAADRESRGAVLFERFWRKYLEFTEETGPFATPWREDAPRTTPDGLKDPAEAVRALQAAALELDLARRPLDVSWGDVYRLRLDDVDLPANGGPGGLGIFRVLAFHEDDDGRFAADFGDSYVAVVEFASPVRAESLVVPGNATQHGSPHRTDQLQLFANKRLRPVWRTRDEIRANQEMSERVVYR